ncbi:HlyD family efflux transporter periplasmic adaptor subunit [Asticcacaulis sp. SL142]|uniref:HlyD family secretion protein n=1 Tax=Asticcacaulis sp. SL142 TaxID=2995155 RepID=UPI00226D1918|nr:HlyD family efflux transporter periplasmic adaptor subunit [Asticcacaulis sp. SL142]WAC49754.1 HlyD family efflux transporter periplasmic adaptor subunit [Asticcacaulis sp. SL142]
MPDDTSFFRKEAVDASRNRTGGPVNNQGLATWMLVVFMVALFVIAVIFLVIARYGKKETVFGQVVPAEGVVRVTSGRAGVITKVSAESGQTVQSGEPLFILSYDAVLEDGSRLSNRVDQITRQQMQLSSDEAMARELSLEENNHIIDAKLNSIRESLPLLREQRSLQLERVAILEKSYEAMNTLAEKAYVSQAQLGVRKDNLLQARQSLLQMDQTLAQQKYQVAQMESELAATRHDLSVIRTNQGNSQAQFQERQLKIQSDQAGRINALKTGQITNLQARVGDFVQANQTLALLVPISGDHLPQVVLWVPSRAIGFVEKGHKVRIMFDAYPYQTFGVGHGHVEEISMAPIMPNELPVPLETKEQMYKVVVALNKDTHQAYGRSWDLKAGMKLTADLVLDEKSLFEWLLDPITALRKRSED